MTFLCKIVYNISVEYIISYFNKESEEFNMKKIDFKELRTLYNGTALKIIIEKTLRIRYKNLMWCKCKKDFYYRVEKILPDKMLVMVQCPTCHNKIFLEFILTDEFVKEYHKRNLELLQSDEKDEMKLLIENITKSCGHIRCKDITHFVNSNLILPFKTEKKVV